MDTFTQSGKEPPNPRRPGHPIDDLFTLRWSPRALRSEPISQERVLALFEAARWAPSCFNEQPWLFLYAVGEEDRGKVLGLLTDGNRLWAGKAPLLAVLFAKKSFAEDGSPNYWASFDCGAAWMSLALQARMLGLFAHAMGGFDRSAAVSDLGVDGNVYDAVCVIAVGRYGDPSSLPAPMREREKPSERKPLSESVSAVGEYRKKKVPART